MPSNLPRAGRTQETADLFRSSPPERYLVAHIDGGARGNPGPAGYGVVITDSSGEKVATLSEYLGKQTNNYAEYSGLLAALKFAVQSNYKSLKLVSDSELMVKQIRGAYRVKNPALKELHQRAQDLIGELDWFQIQHVLREKNREADGLANAAMDQGMGRSARSGARLTTARNQEDLSATSVLVDRELTGVVRGGVVELLNGELPDGTRVQVRVKK